MRLRRRTGGDPGTQRDDRLTAESFGPPVESGAPVTLHVGTPKSGTTSLQAIMARNRGLLREHGVLYPGRNQAHFVEALGLRGSGFRGHRIQGSEGAWERVVAEVLAHDGPAVLSHEILGGSVPQAVARAVESFGGRPVRVVVTCRDLGRQLPAVWQEGVKNGDRVSYADFLQQAFDEWAGAGTGTGFWRGQDLSGVGARWGAAVGSSQVVLVTVPPRGAGSEVLWDRFREAVGLPEASYDVPDQPRNTSMGTVETELLRRILLRLPEDLPWEVQSQQVKRRLAQQTLVQERVGGSLGVPERWRDATREASAAIVAAVEEAGHPVVGDLADLEPSMPSSATDPDSVDPEVLLDRALDVLAPMVLRDRGGKGPGKAPGRRARKGS